MISAVYSLFSGVFNGGSVCETIKKKKKKAAKFYLHSNQTLDFKKKNHQILSFEDKSLNNNSM